MNMRSVPRGWQARGVALYKNYSIVLMPLGEKRKQIPRCIRLRFSRGCSLEGLTPHY
jgi:hypothetical protein